MRRRAQGQRVLFHDHDRQVENLADERRDLSAFVVGACGRGPRKFCYRRHKDGRYVWDVDIPTAEGRRLRAYGFETAEEAIRARDELLGRQDLEAAVDLPDHGRPTSPASLSTAPMIDKPSAPDLGAVVSQYLRSEFPPLDGPVRVLVNMTAELQLVSVQVEPVPGMASRPRRRTPPANGRR
jgi:hypothetical protein